MIKKLILACGLLTSLNSAQAADVSIYQHCHHPVLESARMFMTNANE